MAGIPKVKITFDADFDELKRGVKGAEQEILKQFYLLFL